MALTKLGDTRPLSIIALDLGLPKGMATAVSRYWRQIVRDGHWPEALAAPSNPEEHIRRNLPPIDYQQRRIIADDPRRLVRALNRTGGNSRRLGHEEFHDVIRRYWERFTGGDIRYAAAPYAIPAEHHAEWPQKRAPIDDKHDAIFQNAYPDMITSILPPNGLLTWQPP